MYDHRALPLNAVSPLDPRNKPLPKRPPPTSLLSPFPSPPSSTTRMTPRQLAAAASAIPRSVPDGGGSNSSSSVRKPRPLQPARKQSSSLGSDLFTAFPLPAKTAPYAKHGTAAGSACADSVSSSTLSLPLTIIEPLRLRRGAGHTEEGGGGDGAAAAAQPRPDSAVLSDAPSSSPSSSSSSSSSSSCPPPLRLRPAQQLDGRYFWALQRRGDTVHYWLPVDLVLRGLPGSAYVPRGHWARLVKLAEDVRLSSTAAGTAEGGGGGGGVQLVMGRCSVDEPLGELDVFRG